jgi:hypothetical protein
MKIQTNTNSYFPSQVVSDLEKASMEYGIQVARAIEQQWFNNSTGGSMYSKSYSDFHKLRLYARGEQSVEKYKNELSSNGDLSYLNIDWTPIPVLSKFVDIVANDMASKKYEINAYAQDPFSLKTRTNYAQDIAQDMATKESLMAVKNAIGLDFSKTQNLENLPENNEELDLHMQMSYKQNVEVAEEELINNVLAVNNYENIKRRCAQDLAVLGICAQKTGFDPTKGVTVEYVDPARLVYSPTEDPNFSDIYYVGEIKSISISELKRIFPHITDEGLKKIQSSPRNSRNNSGVGLLDNNTVQILFFEYKTYMDQVFKIKMTEQGLEKALEKPDTFNPPPNDNFERVARTIEVLYTGAKVLGTDVMLQWEMAENMTRPMADTTKVEMNYCIAAPKMYRGRIESLVSKTTGFADIIQLTHLKLQQVMAKVVPDGVFLDLDGLNQVDLGNGTTYNAAEALNMYFQTGSIVGRSLNQDGGLNSGKVPIQELTTSSGQAKIQSLIGTYQYYLQMIRDVTGLNEARDGSMPEKDALVGIQKIAANNSNTATKHLINALLSVSLRICENISLRAGDMMSNPLTAKSLEGAISKFNAETIREFASLQLHDFGIFLEIEPNEEDKALLEQNVQVALQRGSIDLSDAIDIRQIRNISLANQFLKLRQTRKMKEEQARSERNIQVQAQANAESAEKAAMAEVQKQQALTAENINLEKAKNQFKQQTLSVEANIKKELMELEFHYQMQLAQATQNALHENSKKQEDRKDKRIQMQGTQQSELIDQRTNNKLPKNFEGNSEADLLSSYGVQDIDA